MLFPGKFCDLLQGLFEYASKLFADAIIFCILLSLINESDFFGFLFYSFEQIHQNNFAPCYQCDVIPCRPWILFVKVSKEIVCLPKLWTVFFRIFLSSLLRSYEGHRGNHGLQIQRRRSHPKPGNLLPHFLILLLELLAWTDTNCRVGYIIVSS